VTGRAVPWGQRWGWGQGARLLEASGFKQLCLETEEKLYGKWEGSGRPPRPGTPSFCQLEPEIGDLRAGRREEAIEGAHTAQPQD
jgi:hypothetical protein